MNSGSDPEHRRQTLKDRFREETSREILAAAETVFAEQGLHGAAMAQIAERAGVAVGTLYNRFKDRDTLLEALLAERRANLLEKLDAELAELDRASFREQLEGFFHVLFAHFEEHRAFLRWVFASEQGAQAKREQMSRAIHERLDRILERGHSARALRPDVDRSFALLAMSAAKGAVLQRDFYGLPPLAPEQAASMLVDFFLHGAGSQ